VTIDLNMPGMGGQDCCAACTRSFPNTEVVVITGCATVESAAESVRIGICDYLEKPFDVVKVGAAIQRAVSRRRARGGLRSFLEELGAWSAASRTPRRSCTRWSAARSCAASSRAARERGDEGAARAEAEELRTVDFLEVLAETIETKGATCAARAPRVVLRGPARRARRPVTARTRSRCAIAGFLHDLGKVGVPSELLLREGALDPNERKIMEQHP
jgi:response regulator RpfG family c-di-GMP phosphodiesterase